MRAGANNRLTLETMNWKRARDYVIYLCAGLVFVLAIMWYALHGGPDLPRSANKWIGLIIETPVLFGYAIFDHRRFHKRSSFWLVILALIVVHISIFLVVLSHLEVWSPLWFVVLFPIENVCIEATLVVTGHRDTTPVVRKKSFRR